MTHTGSNFNIIPLTEHDEYNEAVPMTETLSPIWMLAAGASSGSSFPEGLSVAGTRTGLVDGWIAGGPAA